MSQSQAQSAVAHAVTQGLLAKLDGSIPCVDCGAPATGYDHRDYDLPLQVEPVCSSCNTKRGPARNHHLRPRQKKEKDVAFGAGMRRWRESLALSTRDLAELSGTSRSAINGLENGLSSSVALVPFITKALRNRAISLGIAALTVIREIDGEGTN